MSDVSALDFRVLDEGVKVVEDESLFLVNSNELMPKKEIDGDTLEVDIWTPQRNIKQFAAGRGAPLNEAARADLDRRSIRVPYYGGYFSLDMDTASNLRAFGSSSRDRQGRDYIDRSQKDFMQEILLTQEQLGFSWLTSVNVTLTFVDGGTLSISTGLTAGDGNQILAQTDVIQGTTTVLDWSVATTDIISNIKAVRRLVRQATGATIDRCVHRSEVSEYLLQNDDIQELLGQGTRKEELGTTGNPGTIGSVLFQEYDGAYVDPATGNAAFFIPANTAIFYSSMNAPKWSQYAVGEVGGLDNDEKPATLRSPASWSWTSKNPVATNVGVKACFLPEIHQPASFAILTVA